MGTEIEDSLEYIFICELVLQQPPKGLMTTFQRQVDINGNVISTQTASISAVSTNKALFTASGFASVVSNVISMPEGSANGVYTDPLSGKVYFELQATSGASVNMLGIGNENIPYDWNTTPADVFCSYTDGTTYGTGTGTSSAFNLTSSRGAMAIDVPNKKLWIRDGVGNWVDGDPATNTGGLTLTASSSEIRAYISNGGAGAGATEITIYNSGFTYAVPSGFTALT